jgi:hypothetical protein
MDHFQVIYKILRTLEAAMDLPEFDMNQISHEDLGVSKERWGRYLEMMSDSGYVNGVTVRRYINGDTQVMGDGVRITLKGLEYLAENGIMQKIYKAAKGIKEAVPGL